MNTPIRVLMALIAAIAALFASTGTSHAGPGNEMPCLCTPTDEMGRQL
jgi:hypothetical protein